MSSNANASGLTPEQSKALKERAAEPGEQKIIAAVKELYECKAQESTFSIYADSAVFHDPIGIAQGKGSIRAQFMGLAKIFEKADIPKFRILENPPNLDKSTILIDQDVVYYRKAASDPTKTVNSLLTIKTDSSHLVTSHTEEWNHSKETTADDGFFGLLNEQRKKITAGVTDMFVGKEPKN
ncbi:hypothetical protein FIBSPDRAFT_728417 [Athelia psychrophila]|uniref:SnoaL-like domain-containing protein n=1 Tax=Athelia psychrophila TaxID=1759441 RepID=A0A166S043_9AGAM|nr:hypothetical protein FIBSPDRAFT_728417 [Fibularhizoctonia sp. CBS 109695]